jgi:hypothetical protein
LSCEGCTKRKKKCDRLVPCTNCRDSGIICVPVERRRLPRGRTRGTGGFVPGQTGTHNMCVDGVHCSRPRLSPGLTIPAVMSMTPSTMEDLSVSTRRVSQDTSEFLQTLRGIGAPYDGTVQLACFIFVSYGFLTSSTGMGPVRDRNSTWKSPH